jgi:hypothetical protein
MGPPLEKELEMEESEDDIESSSEDEPVIVEPLQSSWSLLGFAQTDEPPAAPPQTVAGPCADEASRGAAGDEQERPEAAPGHVRVKMESDDEAERIELSWVSEAANDDAIIDKLRDATKIAERASAEKAAERLANQKEFEEKQKAAAARAADLEQRRKDAPKRAQENKAGTQLD